MSEALSWSGDLAAPAAVSSEGIEDPLLAAVLAARAGQGDMAQLMGEFRAATVYVEAIPTDDGDRALQWVHYQGLTWVPTFTSLEYFAAFFRAADRGDEQIHHGALTGAELIDQCLPRLPRGTGIVLDPLADHVLALPPVAGVVPDELAISAEQ